jgi:hypothetical protein
VSIVAEGSQRERIVAVDHASHSFDESVALSTVVGFLTPVARLMMWWFCHSRGSIEFPQVARVGSA